MVYLIHLDKPLAHAQHYIGYTENLDKRIHRHQTNGGSRFLCAAKKAGIDYQVVRTWPDGDRILERKLKNQKNASRLCPECRKEKNKNAKEKGSTGS